MDPEEGIQPTTTGYTPVPSLYPLIVTPVVTLMDVEQDVEHDRSF